MSTKGNRQAVILASVALFFSLTASATTWIRGERERGKIEKVARDNAVLAEKTNEGLVCLLQRAINSTQENAQQRSQIEVERIVSYYLEEIRLLGGRRDCNTP